MGIMDIFRPAQPQQQATVPANVAAAAGAPATPTSDANGQIPPQQAAGSTEASKETSPLDGMTNIWDTSDIKKETPPASMFDNIDPKAIADAAGQVDFTRAIKPEVLAKIKDGGDDALKAMAQALNTVAQTVYAQNTLANTKISQEAVKEAKAQLLAELPKQVRNSLIDANLQESNPVLSHPAAAPMVSLVKNQLAVKYPTASPAEITKMANEYFVNTMTAITGQDKTKTASKEASTEEVDWSAELGLPSL